MKEKVFYILLFLSAISLAQEKKYFDAPFGGGGGYTPGWIFVNMDELNKQLVSFGSGKLSKSGFYTSGGAGFIYIGFVPGLRVGGMGFGGSTAESALLSGLEREAIYSISGGGFTVEYTLPFIKNMAVSVGTIIGGGGIQIELFTGKGGYEWSYIFTEDTGNISRIKNNFFLLTPTLNIDIPFYRFISFRVGGGYQLAFGKTWKHAESNKELSNVPSKLNGNGFFIQTGIFFGFFSY